MPLILPAAVLPYQPASVHWLGRNYARSDRRRGRRWLAYYCGELRVWVDASGAVMV